ncbi:ABC transporter F family member-like [Raphidocelis subcapitata]|uniref:ABC transporter F family member-like n=1 Tax=Raphidocelis subcapitata TaxID=307507 RepID=A0A2V0NZA1_9CHLO|nr:ABC transporter F family member-like [Raphidocelis subcapitata]|eukprot:GBF90920.1 ABC transporter F family member-like [Raphidocelis subcapitata]
MLGLGSAAGGAAGARAAARRAGGSCGPRAPAPAAFVGQRRLRRPAARRPLRAAQVDVAPAPAAADAPAERAPTGAAAPADGEAPAVAPGVVIGDDNVGEKTKTGSSGISSGLRLEGVAMTFKNHQVLKDCTWEVKKGERAGLVGVNGAGKTTQLQIIMGKLLPDAGEVVKAKRNMRIAYLAQEFDVDPGRTVREEFYSVYDKQTQIMREQEEISRALEGAGEDMEAMQALLDRLDKLNAAAVDLDVNLLDKKIDQMMPELGFSPADNDRLVSSFSGGWQMRMCLGKMLLQDPDVLLLDEPTNHLDLDAIEWLEGYLKKQEVPMVVVSHDREFLDQLCTKIVETERGVSTTYPGNYTEYMRLKAEREALQWVAFEKQQKEIEKQQDLIRRLAGGAQSGRAAAAEKTLERIRAEGLIEKPFVPKRRAFTFPPVEKMGQSVVSIDGLTHGYHGRTLFKDASLEVERGDRVAIIGPNGAGKSTLLRLIMGRERPVKGRVALGEHGIVPNYFEQNQAEALDLELTVLETLERSAPDAQLNELKQLLGRMMFSGTAMDKKVKVLSGGEKARLALAKFMCTKGTLLILDEPTNHLDIPSKETLEEAVRAFEGAVIAVSHDRYFLRRIATRVLQVEGGQFTDVEGDYEYFLSKNEAEADKMAAKEAKAAAIEKSTAKSKSKMTKAEKEKLKKDKAKAFNTAAAGKGKGKGGARLT